MPTIIHNATLLQPAVGGVTVARDTSLVFADGRITEVVSSADVQQRVDAGAFDETIDGRDSIVVPGLVNTHHHLFQSLTRCLPAAQDLRLFDWLLALYERWRDVDYAAMRLAAKISLCELLLHGCTTTSDHQYLFPPATDVRLEAVLSAAEELGIRIHVCRGSMTLGRTNGGLPPDDVVESDGAALSDCQRVLDAYHDPQPFAMRRIDLAPCSPFNVTRELMRDTRAMARERGVLLHTHLAETLDEEAFCLDRYGCRPVQYLQDLEWLGSDVYLAHCVHLSDDEIRLLAQTDTAVAHCPSSNMRLGSGVAPLAKLLDAGVRVGVAVDGSSSNDGGDLLGETRMALLAARLRQAVQPDADEDAALFTAEAALRLATVGGAAVLRRPELGRLDIGAAADFALFDANDVALAGAVAQDPLAALVMCAAPRAAHVYVAGRAVVRNGRVVAVDERRLAAELNALVASRFCS